MPLIKSGSKAAFKKNVETEMDSGKPQAQSLAIAYDMKRRNKSKKMASGGVVNESAKTEHRPMPEEMDKDSKDISQNSSKKSPSNSTWTDKITVTQAQKPSVTKLSRPKMANGILKVRDRADAEKEEHLIESIPPHKMASGGMINEEVSIKDADEDEVMHPAGLESDDDMMAPSEEEYMSNRFAEGGMTEVEEEHHDSIAAAIMARKERQMQLDSDSSIDHEMMMAEGGQVDIDENAEEQPNSYYRRNQEALKENYDEDMEDITQPSDSNEHSDDIDSDKHDRISQIRSRMNMKRQFKVR